MTVIPLAQRPDQYTACTHAIGLCSFNCLSHSRSVSEMSGVGKHQKEQCAPKSVSLLGYHPLEVTACLLKYDVEIQNFIRCACWSNRVYVTSSLPLIYAKLLVKDCFQSEKMSLLCIWWSWKCDVCFSQSSSCRTRLIAGVDHWMIQPWAFEAGLLGMNGGWFVEEMWKQAQELWRTRSPAWQWSVELQLQSRIQWMDCPFSLRLMRWWCFCVTIMFSEKSEQLQGTWPKLRLVHFAERALKGLYL